MTDQRQKILFIDDDLTMHSLIKTFLEEDGYECICASSGSEGLDLVIQKKPHLILLDYMMPGLNGGHVYTELTTNPIYEDYRNTPVIIITAKESDSFFKTKFLEGGVSAYLQKPFRLRELSNVIENVFIINEIKIKNLGIQHEIQKTNDYLESLFDMIPIGILSCDFKGYIKNVNPYFLQIMESDRCDTIIGKNISECYLFKNTKLLKNLKETLTNGTALTISSLNYVTKNANRISLNLKVIPLSDDSGISGGIVIVQDITEADRKAQELEQVKNKLEETYKELKNTQDRLIHPERLATVEKMVTHITHEVRKPLLAIKGFARNIVKLSESDPYNENIKNNANLIVDEVNRLEKILSEEILSISTDRIGHEKI